MAHKNYLAYLSANESHFVQDFLNIYLMTKYHPGVEKLELYLVYSQVENSKEADLKPNAFIEYMVSKCSWLELRKITYKTNIGRDFSSAKVFLESISSIAHAEDIIMIRNRSCHGPFYEGWYLDYVKLLRSKEHVGLVGNTINFSRRRGDSVNKTHVQTYLYVSYSKILLSLIHDFPAVEEEDREKIISDGEIGLSRRILNQGFSICCLFWPTNYFFSNTKREKTFPELDIKHKVKSLPFLHRKNKQHRIRKSLLKFTIVINYIIFRLLKAK